MICKNCGAHFDDNLPKCPFCDALHYAGARKEYMEKLEDMKENLDELHEAVPEMYSNELKSQAKKVRKISFIIAGIFAVLTLFFLISTFALDSFTSIDTKEALLFMKEAYPIADEYYTSGDFDGLLQFYYSSIDENENATFDDWDHYPFLMCYNNMSQFRLAAKNISSGDCSHYDVMGIFDCYISTRSYRQHYPMDEADQKRVSEFEDEMEAFIDTLELTEEEQKIFNDFLALNDYPSWKDIENFSKHIYKRL